MMFEKPYYSVIEAAKKLKISTNDLLQMGALGKAFISIRYLPPYDEERFFVAKPDDSFLGYSEYEHSNDYLYRHCGYALDKSTLSFIANAGKACICTKKSSGFDDVIVLPDDLDDGLCLYLVSYHDINNDKKDYRSKSYITKHDLIISSNELNRLLALKAEHDNKPTCEQLQQQLCKCLKKIERLDNELLNRKKEIHTKSKATVSATFKAINALYDINSEAVAKESQRLGENVAASTVRKYLNGDL